MSEWFDHAEGIAGDGVYQDRDGTMREKSNGTKRHPFAFDPKPYNPPDPAKIPKRDWLYGKHYLRGVVTATLGAPGRLKSTNSMTEIVGMVIGRDLFTGKPLPCGPLRGAYVNGEENQDELDRRFAGVCQCYRIKKEEYEGRIWIISTRDNPLRFAEAGSRGIGVVSEDVVSAVEKWCEKNLIDVLCIDPLVSFHRVRENDNGDMDALYKEGFGKIAGAYRSVELVIHPRKPAQGEVNTTITDLRGGSSQEGALRIARVMNFMTTSEAAQLGIEEEERRLHVRIEGGKGGPGPISKATWRKIAVEILPNGDDVAVAVSWKPPDHLADVTLSHTDAVRELGRTGEYRVDCRSPKWLGWKVAAVLGLKAKYRGDNHKAEMAKIKNLLRQWEKSILDVEHRKDEDGDDRGFYVSRNEPIQRASPVH